MQRIIAHLDMDAFFAAVEERNNPQFAGMPIVVGADPQNGNGRGVVSTANYAARKYGIHSALPITRAWKLSQAAKAQGKPEAIFLPGNFAAYSRISKTVMNILREYTPQIQQRSVDEAYFDLSSTKTLQAAQKVAQEIKNRIRADEQLTCSIGIGPNKLVAKIASDLDKPDGLTVIPEADIIQTLAPLPIRAIPGVGPKTQILLSQCDIHTIRDAQQYEADELASLLGKSGGALYEKVRGIDTSPLTEPSIAKSISEQVTFRHDSLDASVLIPQLFSSCKHLTDRLVSEGFTGFKTIGITVRFSNFQTKSRQITLRKATKSTSILHKKTLQILLPFLDSRENPNHYAIRLVGVRLEKLE